MTIESYRAKNSALRAAQYAFEQSGSEIFSKEAQDLISHVIASAIEAAFDELAEMQVDEVRTSMR